MAKEDEVHFVGQIAQKALIEKDGKILLVQYPDDDHSAANLWDLPGGRLNEGETPLEGVKREVLEEIGAPVDIHGIIATGINAITPTFKLYVVIYRATLVDPNAQLVAEVGEIKTLAWHDKEDIRTLPMLNKVYEEALNAGLL